MTKSFSTCYDCGRDFAAPDVTRDPDDPDRCTDCVTRAARRFSTRVQPSPDLEVSPDEVIR